MEILILWLAFAIFSGVIASSKGRSGIGWALLGLIVGPFALIVAFLPSQAKLDEEHARRKGTSGDFRKCPYCAEAIRIEAVKCRYCGSDVKSHVGSVEDQLQVADQRKSETDWGEPWRRPQVARTVELDGMYQRRSKLVPWVWIVGAAIAAVSSPVW